MNKENQATGNSQLPTTSISQPPPVFNCQVAISTPNSEGIRTGRVLTLPNIEATGTEERQILQQLASKFKSIVQELHEKQEEIPWIEPPSQATSEEVERWIPVHL